MGSLPIPVRTFSHFSTCPHLLHGVFTRRGGVSRPPFDSLNVGFSSGDDPGAVMENRQRILSCLGLSRAVFLHQVHGTDVLILAREDTPDPALFWKPGHPAAGKVLTGDAVVTDLTQLALVIQVADCQAVMLADPQKKVIANVHSGWRGSIQDIIGRCVDVMVHRFGCDPRQILAGISPSLGPCCAEFIHFRKRFLSRCGGINCRIRIILTSGPCLWINCGERASFEAYRQLVRMYPLPARPVFFLSTGWTNRPVRLRHRFGMTREKNGGSGFFSR